MRKRILPQALTRGRIVREGDRFCVVSKDGSRRFGCFVDTQVEFFKFQDRG